MRIIYTILYYLAVPLIFIRLAIRSRRTPAYLKRIPERFGFFEPPAKTGGIWLHSVSVGETIAAVPLIKRLQQVLPDLPITVTTMSPTGSERVKALFNDSVFHVYVPYDLPDVVRRFLTRVNPSLAIIMETEIWPNLLAECQRAKVPVLLANARLSAKSASKYAKIGKFTKTMLQQFALIAAQNQVDAQRFIELGADPKHVTATGSIKFDQSMPASTYEQAAVLREAWGNRRVWIAASTHEGEDELVLDAFQTIKASFPETLLVLVPRHPDRFVRVAQLCRKRGFAVQCRSENQVSCPADVDVFVGDTMGELPAFYAASDVAFVGGSLVPTGGHNLLEPAALGLAAVTGPHVFNFTEITALLVDAGAAFMVIDEKALANKVIALLEDSTLRTVAGAKGQAVVEKNRGTVEAYVGIVNHLLQA